MIPATFRLRPVIPQDAAALHENCWPHYSLAAIREMLERAQDLTRRRRGLGVVALIDEHPIGYVQLTIWPRVAEISDLIVAPTWRANGIGTAMIHHLIDLARQWPMHQVEIGVAQANSRAHALYQRLGFIENRSLTLDLGQGPEPVIYLSMSLN